MKKISVLILSLVVLVILPSAALSGQVEGSIQGLTCVITGKVCPIGQEDPMAAAEKVFVILTKGNAYYFVPNVDRAVLARHINDRVRVTGDIGSKYNAISAKKDRSVQKRCLENELDLAGSGRPTGEVAASGLLNEVLTPKPKPTVLCRGFFNG